MRIYRKAFGYRARCRQRVDVLEAVVTLVSGLYTFSVLCCVLHFLSLVAQFGVLSDYQRLGFEFSFVFFACLVPAIFCCRAALRTLRLRFGKPEIVIL